MEKRMISTEFTEEDMPIESSLRPMALADYIGQEKVKKNLKVYIEAAKSRQEPLDHCLFYGPPGLGKTTIAGVIANEMGVHLKVTSGPAIEKPGDMAAILSNLRRVTCSLWMRYTVLTGRLRRCSTLLWRISR